MKALKHNLTLLCISSMLLFFSCDNDDTGGLRASDGHVAIANQDDGTVSIFNTGNLQKILDITLPDSEAMPTDVAFSTEQDQLFISDFSSEKVWVYEANSFEFVSSYSVGKGSTNLAVNDLANQLWVINTTSKTTSVLNSEDGSTLATLDLDIPELGLEDDAVQHDILIDQTGRYAFIAISSEAGNSFVVQYDTETFTPLRAVLIGDEPRLSATSSKLFILSQTDSSIREFDLLTLIPTGKTAPINNAHGVAKGPNNLLFITDISGREITTYNIDGGENTSLVSADTSEGGAYDLAFSPTDQILTLTISGSTKVEFYLLNAQNELVFIFPAISGENPKGITFFRTGL